MNRWCMSNYSMPRLHNLQCSEMIHIVSSWNRIPLRGKRKHWFIFEKNRQLMNLFCMTASIFIANCLFIRIIKKCRSKGHHKKRNNVISLAPWTSVLTKLRRETLSLVSPSNEHTQKARNTKRGTIETENELVLTQSTVVTRRPQNEQRWFDYSKCTKKKSLVDQNLV